MVDVLQEGTVAAAATEVLFRSWWHITAVDLFVLDNGPSGFFSKQETTSLVVRCGSQGSHIEWNFGDGICEVFELLLYLLALKKLPYRIKGTEQMPSDELSEQWGTHCSEWFWRGEDSSPGTRDLTNIVKTSVAWPQYWSSLFQRFQYYWPSHYYRCWR